MISPRMLAAILALPSAALAQSLHLARVDFAVPADPRGVAVADFTADGRTDLAVASSGPNRVSILVGLPGLTAFAAPSVAGPSASGPNGLAAADFDGDGLLDLATAGADAPSLVVLHGTGAGSFAPLPLPATATAGWIESGDLDGDGRVDLTTSSYEASAYSQTVYLASAGGSFAPPVAYALPDVNAHCALGDVDADGDLDLAAGNQGPGLRVLWNDGAGAFTDALLPGVQSMQKYRVSLGDTNGDGIPDLISRQVSLDADTYFYLGTGASFVSPKLLWFGSRPELSDLNGDGLTDAVASYDDSCCSLRVAPAAGTGGLGAFKTATLPADGWDIDTGEIDGGGWLDIAVAVPSANLVSVFRVTPAVPPVVNATSPVVVPSAAGAPVELKILGDGLGTLTKIELGSLTWTLPSTDVVIESASVVKVMLPAAVSGGPIEQLELTNTVGTVQFPVLIGPPQTPVVLIQNPFSVLSGGAKLVLGSKPGDIVFLAASPDLAPSSLPGLLDLSIGNGFASLVYLGASLVPAEGGLAKLIPLAGLPPFFPVHFQMVALDPLGTLPLPASAVASGIVL